MSKKYKICVDQCPKHQAYFAISVGDENCGTRLTPSKCCGQWTEVAAWKATPELLERMITELVLFKGQIEVLIKEEV